MLYTIRDYDHKNDLEAAKRIWQEVHWLSDPKDASMLDHFFKDGRALVADLNGSAECMVTAKPGHLKYLKETLDISIVTSVTTSRIARKQGLAKMLTAQLIAEETEAGSPLSTLGIFEEGFYDQLGYGTGPYVNWLGFDPANILVDRPLRPPQRLTEEDASRMHQALVKRRTQHGGVTLLLESFMKAELAWAKDGFGLGYSDDETGELTHFFWASSKGEHGPIIIYFMAFRNNDQLLELMALLKSLGDQVRLVKLREPAGIQLQDLIKHPMRSRIVTEKSNFEQINRALAYWQIRICDLQTCLSATHLNSRSLSFNLELTDPLSEMLKNREGWQGCAGEYTVHLGQECSIAPGFTQDLPVLEADIGAFTRLWLGVKPATGLALSGGLKTSPALLADLDEVLCLPVPQTDWEF